MIAAGIPITTPVPRARTTPSTATHGPQFEYGNRCGCGSTPSTARLASMSPAVSQVSRSTKTRLRFLRRLVFVVVLVVLAMIALSQFTELKRLAAGILASTAVLGLIVGFAAQHTIANLVAGVQIAISQPFRIGDRISFEENRGPGHRHHPLLHLHRPRRRQPLRDPEPAAGRRHRPQPLDRRHAGLSARRAAKSLSPMTQRNRRRQRRRGGIGGKLLLVGGAVLALVAIAVIGVTSWVLDVAADAPSLATCKPIDKGGNSALYAADGSKLGVIASDEARTPVSIKRIPKTLQLATVAIEDQRFYEHGGVDYEGIVRAALKDLEAGEAVEGGSTITQQLVRNLCITNPQQNLERKIVEAKLATEYSKRHSRQEILGSYLNIASYGTIEGSTAVGRAGGLADLLRQAGLEADPAAGGAAGRAAAGALRIQPDPQPGGGARTPQRGAAADGQARLRLRRPGRGGASARARSSTSPTTTSTTASPTSSTTSRTS